MTMGEQIAAVIVENRAVENWSNPRPSDYELADAIIAALPSMIPDLVWTVDARWPGSSVSFCGLYSIEEQDEESFSVSMADDTLHWFDTIEAAKAAANAHHRAAVCKAMGIA